MKRQGCFFSRGASLSQLIISQVTINVHCRAFDAVGWWTVWRRSSATAPLALLQWPRGDGGVQWPSGARVVCVSAVCSVFIYVGQLTGPQGRPLAPSYQYHYYLFASEYVGAVGRFKITSRNHCAVGEGLHWPQWLERMRDEAGLAVRCGYSPHCSMDNERAKPSL